MSKKTETRKMPQVGEKGTRDFAISNTREINIEERTVDVAFASEEPYRRWWGTEIIDLETMDLSRMNDGAAVLFNHNWNDHIGTVVPGSARIDSDGFARCTLRFGKSALASEKFQDIQDGILSKISFGYMITKYLLVEETETEEIYRVSTEPYEVSPVVVPADATVGVGKALEDDSNVVDGSTVGGSKNINVNSEVPVMEKSTESTPTTEPAKTEPTVDVKKIAADAKEAALKEQRAYETEIRDLCKMSGKSMEEAQRWIEEDTKPEFVRELILKEKAEAEKSKTVNAFGSISQGDDNVKKRAEERATTLAHIIAPKLVKSPSDHYKFGSFHGLIRQICDEKGINHSGMSSSALVDTIFSGERSMSTGDFPEITKDAINKVTSMSYQNAQLIQDWRPLADFTSTDDYKELNNGRLSPAPGLKRTADGAAPERGSLTEEADKYKVEDYSGAFSLTRQLLINDDTRAFRREINSFGASAAGLETDLFMDIFQNGDVFGSPVYSVGRNNLHATTALDIDGLSLLRASLRKQVWATGGKPLNLRPRYLVVNADMQTEAEQLINATIVPTEVGNANVFRGALTVISDANLAAGAWYVVYDGQYGAPIEMATLTGAAAPLVEQEVDWKTKSLDVQCWHTIGGHYLDYRGVQKATLA